MTRRSFSIMAVAATPLLLGQAPATRDGTAPKARKDRMLELYRADATRYVIHKDSTWREKVELRPEPVYVWSNPVREYFQEGALFVWTCRGRAEAIGSIF